MSISWAAHGWEGGRGGGGVKKVLVPKICYTYPTMMKLGIIIEISNFCYVKKYRYRLHFNTKVLIFLTFFCVFKGCFNKHGYNLDGLLGLLKI